MAYLFTYFTREKDDGEQVYFSVSSDGLLWQDLSSKPTLIWHGGDGGVRDPYIVKQPQTGTYYVMATDLCIKQRKFQWDGAVHAGSRNVVLWSSEDLINWSEPWPVTIASEGADCCRAPEAVWDPQKQAFLLFFSSYTEDDEIGKHRMYAAYTENFVIDDLIQGKAAVLAEKEFCFGALLKRHGGVIEISGQEYEKLLAHYGLSCETKKAK